MTNPKHDTETVHKQAMPASNHTNRRTYKQTRMLSQTRDAGCGCRLPGGTLAAKLCTATADNTVPLKPELHVVQQPSVPQQRAPMQGCKAVDRMRLRSLCMSGPTAAAAHMACKHTGMTRHA